MTATTVVIKEPRVIPLIAPWATDTVYKHISIGCGGRGRFVKILCLRARDFLLMAAKPEWVAWLEASTTITETCWEWRCYGLLVVSICVSSLCQWWCKVQVNRLDTWLTIPFSCETKRWSTEKAPAFPRTAGAGVGAGWRRTVDAISHSAWRWRGGEGLLPLTAASAEDRQSGHKCGTAWDWFTHLYAEGEGRSEETNNKYYAVDSQSTCTHVKLAKRIRFLKPVANNSR